MSIKIGEKFIKWLKDPYNLILFILLIAFVIFRFYFFFSTVNQPLWWDEAYYMNNARTWLGQIQWEVDAKRPILFPLILTFFSLLGFKSEILPRLFVLFCSIATVPLIFGVGKLLFNKRVALVSALVMAVFWSFSFFSYRILVDVPLTFLWLATIYFFFNSYFKNKSYKHFILAGILLGLSFLMKFSSIILVALISIYLLTTEKSKIFVNKKIIIFYLFSFLTVLPFFMWQYLAYGNPLAFFFGASGGERSHTFIQALFDQAIFSFKAMHPIFYIFLGIGFLITLANTLLLSNKIHQKNSMANKSYFVILWVFLALLFFGWFDYGSYIEERYFFIFYPALFILVGEGVLFVYEKIKNYNKQIVSIGIIILICIGAYQNIAHTNQIIQVKKESFLPLKQAGLYLKNNTNPEDLILLVEEPAEIVYYSERNYYHLSKESPEELIEIIKERNPKYLIFSFYYSLNDPKKVNLANFIFINKKIFIPVESFGPYIDKKRTLPIVVIFKINPPI